MRAGDEELLIHLVFFQKVRLSGIQIKAPSSNGPKSVKLIVNVPSLDFDSCARSPSPTAAITLRPFERLAGCAARRARAKSTKVTQEVQLSQEGLVSNAKVDLKLPLFSSVGEVTLLIEGNHDEDEETIISSLALWGSVIEIVGKRNDAPHLGKWSEDSAVEKYEKDASAK